MFQKLDQWLISRVFQGIVDLSQRQPAWWVRQLSMLVALCGVAWFAFVQGGRSGLHVIYLLCILALAAGGWAYSMVPELLRQGMGAWNNIRVWYVPLCLVSWTIAIVAPDAEVVAYACVVVAMLCLLYFAACEPPRPREPRRKMAGQGV